MVLKQPQNETEGRTPNEHRNPERCSRSPAPSRPADNVVAYDIMREKAVILGAEINRVTPDDDTAVRRLIDLDEEVDAVDGYDRAAVDRMDAILASRIQAIRAMS